jgi:iron(III) transport system ATP-binding protein
MLSIKSLTKRFPPRAGEAQVVAIDGIDLDIRQGELFALLGPSGCGKTTMLQGIAGLESPDAGTIAIGDRVVVDVAARRFVPANERGLGMVFQSYAVWPHMTVYENVAFPLRHGNRRFPEERIRAAAMAALQRVRLEGLAERPAPFLSGGQQQRVALARAIVHEPRLLLLDEPLSNLDARLRDEMRTELRQLVKDLGITTVFVTHDQVEAMGMADRVALLNGGRIAQIGTPQDLYFRPASAFVANFVGQANVLPGRVVDRRADAGGVSVLFETAMGVFESTLVCPLRVGEAGACVIRPGAVVVAPEGRPGMTVCTGTLHRPVFLGDRIEADFRSGDGLLRVSLNAYDAIDPSAPVTIGVPAERCVVVAGTS